VIARQLLNLSNTPLYPLLHVAAIENLKRK
jgi:hypothetical protein